jgi:hypothetical protein
VLKIKPALSKRKSNASPRVQRPSTRRTTVTLPADLLRKIERLAATRHQTLSSAVTYLVESALRNEPELQRSSIGILEMWRKAYLPLTEDERLLVDGIVVDRPADKSE